MAQTDLKYHTLPKESHLGKDKNKAHPNVALATSSPKFAKGQMIQARVNGNPTELLLDTGSAVTLLRLDTWVRCKGDSDQLEQWTRQRLVGVDGTPLEVAGGCKVEITLAQATFTHFVLVVDSLLSDGIIGLDFLQQNQCSVDLAKGRSTLYVGPHKVAVRLSSATGAEHEYINVVAAHTVCIPERSELEIPATAQDPVTDGGTYLLEGTGSDKSSALIARAVVSPTNNTVIVRVLNPQKRPITLYQNAKIAVLQKLPVTAVCVATTD